MKREKLNLGWKYLVLGLLAVLFIGRAGAVPELDGVSFDPAFISAGDTVDISANIHERDRVPDTEWDGNDHLKAVLKTDNKLARDYVTIEKNRDDTIGFLYPQGVWNQNYRVKVDSDAPTGNYSFEIHIQYINNEDQTSENETVTFIKEFDMPVEKEGVSLYSETLRTNPRQPRPGDDYVDLKARITNTGNKPIEEIKIKPDFPEGVEPAYSDSDSFFIGRMDSSSSETLNIGLDLDEDLDPGLYELKLDTEYEDTDSNTYSSSLMVPLRVEGRPDLEVKDRTTVMKAGESKEVVLEIKNTGTQDAESVTARIIAERTQPFSLDDRSNYVGEIKPGETSEAVMKVTSKRDSPEKVHNLKVQLRASGDSEEGDHSTYSFTENTKVKTSGKTSSPLIPLGVFGAIAVSGVGGFRVYQKRGE